MGLDMTSATPHAGRIASVEILAHYHRISEDVSTQLRVTPRPWQPRLSARANSCHVLPVVKGSFTTIPPPAAADPGRLIKPDFGAVKTLR